MGMSISEYRRLTAQFRPSKTKVKTTYNNSDCLSEYTECCDLVYKLNELKDEGKIVEFTHISNETFTKSWNVKRKNKALGVRCGVPDYLLILPNKIVFIEMKRVKNSSTSPEQKAWIEAINAAGGYARVCRGCEEAIKYVEGLIDN